MHQHYGGLNVDESNPTWNVRPAMMCVKKIRSSNQHTCKIQEPRLYSWDIFMTSEVNKGPLQDFASNLFIPTGLCHNAMMASPCFASFLLPGFSSAFTLVLPWMAPCDSPVQWSMSIGKSARMTIVQLEFKQNQSNRIMDNNGRHYIWPSMIGSQWKYSDEFIRHVSSIYDL